jgi:lysophospholipase
MKLHSVAGNEIPSGLKAGELTTSDGVTLRYAISEPTKFNRGTVCIFPGRADFIERYFETIQDLQRRSFAVAIIDWRGQGGSQRRLRNSLKGYVRSFAKYDIDLECFVRQVVLPDCPPPYFGLAHSTGGHILMRSITRHTWFEQVIMTAPFIDVGERFWPRLVITTAARLAVALGFGRAFVPGEGRRLLTPADFPGNRLTSDLTRFTRNIRVTTEHPHLGTAGPTFRWLNAAVNSIQQLKRMPRSGEPRCPVMLVLAGLDHVVSTEASRKLAERVPNISAVTIDYARHEILNEKTELREQFWAAFDSFVADRRARVRTARGPRRLRRAAG